VEQAVTPAPGFAPGFSQPLSDFQASPSFGALFHALTVCELLPSERSPHKGRVPLSRPLAPLRLSTVCARARRSRPYHLGFPRLPRLSAVAWFPPRLWVPFPRGRSPASRSPWAASGGITPYHQLHPLRSFPPSVSPFAPTRVAPRRWSLLSWVFSPLKTEPSKPLSLAPARPRRAEHAPRPRAQRRDEGDRVDPRRRVKRHRRSEDPGSASSAVPAPVGSGPHRLSAATLSLLTFQPASTGPGLQSFPVLETLAVLRRDPPASCEVSCLFKTSRFRSVSRSWLSFSLNSPALVSARLMNPSDQRQPLPEHLVVVVSACFP
jgi:hypothetical protein